MCEKGGADRASTVAELSSTSRPPLWAIVVLHQTTIGSYTIEVSYAIVQRSEGPLTISTSPVPPTRPPVLAPVSSASVSTPYNTHTTLIITSLSPLPVRSSHELETLARPFGEVLHAFLAKTVAVVIFASSDGARGAARALNGKRYRGARLDVEIWEEWEEEQVSAAVSCGCRADSLVAEGRIGLREQWDVSSRTKSSSSDDTSSMDSVVSSELGTLKTRKRGLDPLRSLYRDRRAHV